MDNRPQKLGEKISLENSAFGAGNGDKSVESAAREGGVVAEFGDWSPKLAR